MASFDYTHLKDRDTRSRGARDAASDAADRAKIRLVNRDRPTPAESKQRRLLAAQVVHNFEGSDPYLLKLQAVHAKDLNWLPSPGVASAVLLIVRHGEHEFAA